MAAKISYLFQSPTGWFEYRRKTPKRLSQYFPQGKQREWKQALDTKDVSTAQRRWALENTKFEKAKSLAEKLCDKPQELLSVEILEAANRIVIEAGLHPDQAPTLRPKFSDAEKTKFDEDSKLWEEQYDILTGIVDDRSIDEEQMQKDYETGAWSTTEYQIPRKRPDPRNPATVAWDIASGNLKTSLKATWRDAVENYIRTNKADNSREAVKEIRWERKTRQLMERFGHEIGGMNTNLEDLDRQHIRDWLWSNFKAATRNRYNNQLSAVINCWNREQPENIHNPFSGLSNKKQEKKESIDRRSLKPEEWHCYLEQVNTIEDDQLKIISLLMIYTGCRTSEAAGIQVKDLKLAGNMPHVVFRTNKIRRMDKDGLERAVPLLTPVLDALRAYELKSDNEAPAFPKYGNTKGFDIVSTKQRQILRQKANILSLDVTPYSTRHTFKDRGIAAGIHTAEREYMMGHKADGSSAIHKKYGTMTPPEMMFENIVKIFQTKTWGYYED